MSVAEETLYEKHFFQSEISCAKAWHAMCFREAYKSEHVNIIKVFHDANPILYTVTDIYLKGEILLDTINVFRSENLALFTVTSIYSIRCNIDSQMKYS